MAIKLLTKRSELEALVNDRGKRRDPSQRLLYLYVMHFPEFVGTADGFPFEVTTSRLGKTNDPTEIVVRDTTFLGAAQRVSDALRAIGVSVRTRVLLVKRGATGRNGWLAGFLVQPHSDIAVEALTTELEHAIGEVHRLSIKIATILDRKAKAKVERAVHRLEELGVIEVIEDVPTDAQDQTP